jgi:malate dehydrogenase (oxaloacetate-decarboxylating)(NADP+)
MKVGDADALITGVAQSILHSSRPMMEIIEWHQVEKNATTNLMITDRGRCSYLIRPSILIRLISTG